jgi:hypothetical protein
MDVDAFNANNYEDKLYEELIEWYYEQLARNDPNAGGFITGKLCFSQAFSILILFANLFICIKNVRHILLKREHLLAMKRLVVSNLAEGNRLLLTIMIY